MPAPSRADPGIRQREFLRSSRFYHPEGRIYTMHTRGIRISALLFSILLLWTACGSLGEAALPQEADVGSLLGEWAFDYEPTVLVLRLSEDGSAWYKGQEYTWEEDGSGFLKLTDESGALLSLRYSLSDGKTVIYPQTSYHRGKEVEGQGGIIGIWEGVSDGSTFVFTPSGKFLEDNAFAGYFLADPDAGTFLLHYGEIFEDTLCYYSIDQEILTIEYPWTIVKKQT